MERKVAAAVSTLPLSTVERMSEMARLPTGRVIPEPDECGLCGADLSDDWGLVAVFAGHLSVGKPYCIPCVRTRMTFGDADEAAQAAATADARKPAPLQG
jgi:hypothetical protein